MSRISIPFKEVGVNAYTYGGITRLGRVQNANIDANMQMTPVQELGSDRLVGRIFGLPEVSVQVSSMDVGSRTAFVLANRNWATASPTDAIELQDISYVCLALVYRGLNTNDVASTLYVPGAKLDSLSMNYSVTGDATEDFSFQATSYRLLAYDVAVASGTLNASYQLSLPTTPAPRVLKNGRHILSAFSQTRGYLPEDAIVSTTATQVTFNPQYVSAGDVVLVTYHADLSNAWQYTYEYPNVPFGYTPPPDQPPGMRGWGIEIFLVRTGQQARRVVRAQSCTIQAQINTTRIEELGNETAVGYSDNIPEITGTLELLRTDLQMYRLLAGDLNATDDNFTPDELGRGNWGMLIRMWRRNANRQVDEPEKTIWIPTLDISQVSDRAQVGQDATLTFNWASRTNQMYIYRSRHPSLNP